MKDFKEICKRHEKHIQSMSPLFKDVEQEEFFINADGTVVLECFKINGYEFTKQYMGDTNYNHLFKDITFLYDYYNRIVFVDNEEIYTGIELLNTINDELNEYNKIEDLAHFFFGKDLEEVSLETFLNVMVDFNDKFENAIDDLDTFISENEDELMYMEV